MAIVQRSVALSGDLNVIMPPEPYGIAWMNKKWINIRIAEIHLHHILATDETLYPSTHGGHRNARSLPTNQDKRELAGGREGGVAGFALRGSGPGGSRAHCDVLSEEPSAKMPNTSDENLTYCSNIVWELHKNLPRLSQRRTFPIISQDDCVIYRKICGAKAS